jgi:putative nucleotidyltransferase with HDIG domain
MSAQSLRAASVWNAPHYFRAVITAGTLVTLVAAVDVYLDEALNRDWLLLGALTLLTGSFTIRIPRLSIRISVSDAFVFASVMMFGASVGTVIVAVDSVVATLWMRRENRSLLRSSFNLSVATTSLWTASQAFWWLIDGVPEPIELTALIWPTCVLAGVYFLLNSWLIAVALSYEQGLSVRVLWRRHFPVFSLNYFVGASTAALLFAYQGDIAVRLHEVVPSFLPVLAISYFTYKTLWGRVHDAEQHLQQMNELYMSTIEALAMAVDAKDQITHGHIRRVQVYAVELAKRLGVSDRSHLKAIETAALLHDMGKLAIPEHILNKPGSLTQAEFATMQKHADVGAELLSSIKFPYPVVPIVRHHHEHWDGHGYPARIAANDIPLGARILSVVDCYDALTSDRPYRPRLSNADAFEVLRSKRGTMYDPLVVDTFCRVHAEISPLAVRAGQEARSVMHFNDATAQESAERATALADIRSSAFQAALFSELHRNLGILRSPHDVFQAVAAAMRNVIPARIYALFVYRPGADTLVCAHSFGDPELLLLDLSIRVGDRVSGWVAATRRASMNSDASLDLGPVAAMLRPAVKSMISVPVVRNGSLVGVLSAYSARSDAFTEANQHTFEYAADLLSKHVVTPGSARDSVVPFASARL